MKEKLEMEEDMDNWKQFQGTELGSLLGSIYGSQRPKINYPKPTLNKSNSVVDRKGFIPGGAKIDAVDPRKATRRSVNLVVPKPSGSHHFQDENMKPVDLIPHRKSADVIKHELDDIKMRQERYRPANVKPISSDLEKDRLNQIFTFKGGKGLPEELTLPVGETPFELAEKAREKERLDAIRRKRGLMVVKSAGSSQPLSYNDQMAQQITSEIQERTKYLEEMKAIGIKPEQERRLKQDLANKIDELNRLNVN